MDLKKINNLVQLFNDQYKLRNKDEIFLTSLKEPKIKYSWEKTKNFIKVIAEDLKKIANKGDRCLLISENRPEWLIVDIAIMYADLISVPTYTTYSSKDYEHIINDCTPSIIFVSNDEQLKKIKNIIKNKIFIKKIYSIDNLENEYDFDSLSLKDLLLKTKTKDESFDIPKIKRLDPACIIYTSGTQGKPKGVILSHGGILSNCKGAIELLNQLTLGERLRFLTWLPLSHSYEHTVQFVQISLGAEIYYAESLDKLIKNMNDCKPHIMTAVPRFYQNLYQKIYANFNKNKGLKKILINKTLSIGHKKIKKIKLSFFEKLQDLILDQLVRKKIKAQFGGCLKTFVSGGGALNKEIGYFLNAIGLPTLQGYGLTESSPVVSCNPIDDIRVETVGPPFKENQVIIADDGEILVKGENVMIGYWNNPAETNKVLKNGWLYTGDIGVIENNYLKITDRKKDILISPGGDNISPIKIENEILNSKYFDQALVYGDNKPYLVALLALSEEGKTKQINEIELEIENINKNFSKIEKIKKYFFVEEKFSIENGMLTPTLKLKRFKIINIYQNKFEKLYKIN